MYRMALPNRAQAVPHQELVVARREDGRRDVHQDGDPAVIQIGEGLPAEEDGGHDPSAQVSSEIGADGDAGETPDHGAVGEADGEGGADGRDEGVGRVEVGPDHDADEGVDEEFGEEEVTEVAVFVFHVRQHCLLPPIPQCSEKGGGGEREKGENSRLVRIRESTQDTRRTPVIHQPFPCGDTLLLEHLDLRPVHPHHQQPGDEGAEDLAENVVRHFLPRKPLPDGEADGDGGVEMAARGGGAGDDGEGDADGEGPADLEEGAEDGDAEGFAGG